MLWALIVGCVVLIWLGLALCKVSGDSARREEYWWMHQPDDDDGVSVVTNTHQDS